MIVIEPIQDGLLLFDWNETSHCVCISWHFGCVINHIVLRNSSLPKLLRSDHSGIIVLGLIKLIGILQINQRHRLILLQSLALPELPLHCLQRILASMLLAKLAVRLEHGADLLGQLQVPTLVLDRRGPVRV